MYCTALAISLPSDTRQKRLRHNSCLIHVFSLNGKCFSNHKHCSTQASKAWTFPVLFVQREDTRHRRLSAPSRDTKSAQVISLSTSNIEYNMQTHLAIDRQYRRHVSSQNKRRNMSSTVKTWGPRAGCGHCGIAVSRVPLLSR